MSHGPLMRTRTNLLDLFATWSTISKREDHVNLWHVRGMLLWPYKMKDKKRISLPFWTRAAMQHVMAA